MLLTMSTFTASVGNDIITLKCDIPDGISIGQTKYGMGIFASKHFVKGQVLYTGYYTLIDDNGLNKDIKMFTGGQEYPMTTEMHTVAVGVAPNKQRQMFYFDAFMNHSCDPNTFSTDETTDESGGSYKTVALRDIAPGTEITCDYDLFELDSRDKGIDICECGSSHCRGFAHGFLFLSEENQARLVPRLYIDVAEAWAKVCSNVLHFSYDLPEGIGIRLDEDGSMHLVATQEFHQGDTMYSYSSIYIDTKIVDTILVNVPILHPERCAPSSGGAVMWAGADRVTRLLTLIDHTVNRGDGMREFFGFDTFCDHACTPNVDFVYVNGSRTETVTTAAVDIHPGEYITCDYTQFDEGRDGSEFVCTCGASNCHGVIRG